MNKSELIETVVAATDKSKKDVTEVINATIDAVQAAVASGDRVEVKGFGAFERRFRAGGERRNPKGGTVLVDDKFAPAFKAGATFKATVNSAA